MSYAFKTAQQALNVRDFFQPGDPDYTAAFNRAIAQANTYKIDVFIPPGVWEVSETTSADSLKACIRLSNVSGFDIFGVPGSSIIKLRGIDLGAPARLSILQVITDCSQIGLRDFTIDGNVANVSNPPSAFHFGLDVASGTDITIDRVIVHSLVDVTGGGSSRTAGIKIGERISAAGGGQTTGNNARIAAKNCIAFDCQAGIELYEECDEFAELIDCVVFDCTLYGCQFTARTPWPYTLIDGCLFTLGTPTDRYAFNSNAGADAQLATQIVLRNSSFVGPVSIGDMGEVVCTNNLFYVEEDPSFTVAVDIPGFLDECVFANNIVIAIDEIALGFRAGSGSTLTVHSLIENNFMVARQVLSLLPTGVTNCTVVGNTFIDGRITTGATRAISLSQVTNSTVPGGEYRFLDNYFSGSFFQIFRFTTSTNIAGTLGQITIVGNEFKGSTAEFMTFAVATAPYDKHPIIARNNARFGGGTPDFISIASMLNLPNQAYIDGGNPGGLRGGVRYTGWGDPVTNGLPGNQGDSYRQLDPALLPAGALWIYEAGAWRQK